MWDSKLAVHRCQQESELTGYKLKKQKSTFWERLQDAFFGANAPEIAKKLDLEKQAVYKWRERLPGLETLIAISETTGCSLHWLVTGEGPQTIDTAYTGTPLFRIEPEPELEPVAFSVEEKAAIRREVLEVLKDLLVSSRDRKLTESLLADLERQLTNG